jgi:hypothetical protein
MENPGLVIGGVVIFIVLIVVVLFLTGVFSGDDDDDDDDDKKKEKESDKKEKSKSSSGFLGRLFGSDEDSEDEEEDEDEDEEDEDEEDGDEEDGDEEDTILDPNDPTSGEDDGEDGEDGEEGIGEDGGLAPIDCVGEFSEWTECTANCGGGTQTRTYQISKEQNETGQACDFVVGHVEERACNEQACPVDCQGSWGEWTSCSRDCGTGEQTKTYTVTTPSANGGKLCMDNGVVVFDGQQESKSCNTQPCPINCEGEFGSWTLCSKTCGGGTKSRTFKILKANQFGGKACDFDDNHTESEGCNEQPCPIDCEENWTAWSACSHAQQGEQKKTFNRTVLPQHGGKACAGPATGTEEVQVCNTSNERQSGSGDSPKTYTIPGPKGKEGRLDIRGRWWKGSGSRRTTGIDVWVAEKHMVTWKRKESSMGWRKGDTAQVRAKCGDVIKVQDHGSRTFNASVYWRFFPGEAGGSSSHQQPGAHKA